MVQAAEAAVPIPAAALKQAIARAVEAEMPADKAERGEDEDDQDFSGGALHGAQLEHFAQKGEPLLRFHRMRG